MITFTVTVCINIITADITSGTDITEKMTRRLIQYWFCRNSNCHCFIKLSYTGPHTIVIHYLLDQACSITLMEGFMTTWYSTWHQSYVTDFIIPLSLELYSRSMHRWTYKKDNFRTDKCWAKPIQSDFISETEVYVTQCCTPMTWHFALNNSPCDYCPTSKIY